MVKTVLLFFCLFCTHLHSSDVDVSASIEATSTVENHPISGLITVTHDKQIKIDPKAFKIEGKPLMIDLLREENIKELTVSAFRFRLDPKPPGLYLLPSITLSINGSSYKSSPISYEVRHVIQGTTNASIKPVLNLEALYEGPSPLYLGDRGFLIYRITYNTSIDLNLSQLPFLQQEDFQEIGDVQVVDSQSGDLSMQEIKQEIEAIKQGTFTYGPSLIEGYSYVINSYGEKEVKERLHAEAPPITVVVKPFPSKGIPPSFNGAIGEFNLKTALVGSSDVFVGDQIKISFEISGKGNLSDIRLPNFFCQPGFSGLFHPSDLPPAGSINETTKQFVLTLRPRSPFIKAVPSMEFSYFNPQIQKYVRLHSTPLPLNIKLLEEIPNTEKPNENEVAIGEWRESLTTLPPITIQGNVPIKYKELSQNLFKSWWVILIIPLGALLLLLQIYLQSAIEARRRLQSLVSSEVLLNRALQQRHDPDKMLPSITNAFLVRLIEKGFIKNADIAPEEIPATGVLDDVRKYLAFLEGIRFGRIEDYSVSEIADQARSLFKKI